MISNEGSVHSIGFMASSDAVFVLFMSSNGLVSSSRSGVASADEVKGA